MNRRGFFKAVGAAVLGMAIALKCPDRRPMEVSFDFPDYAMSDEQIFECYIRPAAAALMRDFDNRMLARFSA